MTEYSTFINNVIPLAALQPQECLLNKSRDTQFKISVREAKHMKKMKYSWGQADAPAKSTERGREAGKVDDRHLLHYHQYSQTNALHTHCILWQYFDYHTTVPPPVQLK